LLCCRGSRESTTDDFGYEANSRELSGEMVTPKALIQ
jgi:hypothetical protein